MNGISNFYNTLLGIEVSIFGIITAVVFVFIQLMYSSFSHKHIQFIFKNKLLWAYFTVSFIDLLLTGAGSFLLSIEGHDLIPCYDFKSNLILTNPYFIFFCIFLTFASNLLFVFFIFKNFKYLQPSKILLLSSRTITYPNLRNFLFNKFGIRPPLQVRLVTFDQSQQEELDRHLKEMIGDMSKPELDELVEKVRESERTSESNLKKYNVFEQNVGSAIDPLEPINDIIMQSIAKADFKTLEDAEEIICKVSTDFINNIPVTFQNEWDPDKELAGHFIKYLVENMDAQLEMCDREKLSSAKLKILDTSKYVAGRFLDSNNTSPNKIIRYWKTLADKAIGNSTPIFNRIIEHYYDIGGKAFEKNNKEVLEEVFRSLGWLGERLLSKTEPENKPIMIDYDYRTEYDELLNCLLSFRSKYDEVPESYPLIYFDAVWVVILHLIRIYKKNNDLKTRDNLLSCMYVYSSFSKNAIRVGNNRGAALGAIRLEEIFKKLKENSLPKEVEEAIRLFTEIGTRAREYKEKLEKVDFLEKHLDEWAMDILASEPEFISAISWELKESLIKSSTEGNHDRIWSFITTLGRRMRTNFGFMFDWTTGKTYSEDDPRRH